MKIHTCFISFNRLDLTKRAISSYEDTVTLPHTICVVDNNSQDGAREWLSEQAAAGRFHVILLPENKYPGYACNRGWEQAPENADFLQRCDNDWAFLPGWCEHVQECFANDEKLGQLGLRTGEWESFNSWNVAGDCIIRRELWDKGLRWDERRWDEFPPMYSEDSFFSPAVLDLGYTWTRIRQPCIQPIADETPDDPYYIESWKARRMLSWALARHGWSPEQIARYVRETQ